MPKQEKSNAEEMSYEVIHQPNERYQQQVAAREAAEANDAKKSNAKKES